MSGVAIIAALLEADPAVLARFAAGNIKAGRLPDNIALPALLLRSVSDVEQQMLRRGGTVRTVERVSATLRIGAYEDIVPVLKLVRRACAGFTGDIAGFARVSVLTAGMGPEVNGPANSFERAQDFRVSFDAPA